MARSPITGHGHATDTAVLLGLIGERPAEIDPAAIPAKVAAIRNAKRITLGGEREIAFDPDTDLVFDRKTPSPGHPNGLRLIARDADGGEIANRVYFSVGGGFVVSEDQYVAGKPAGGGLDGRPIATRSAMPANCSTSARAKARRSPRSPGKTSARCAPPTKSIPGSTASSRR